MHLTKYANFAVQCCFNICPPWFLLTNLTHLTSSPKWNTGFKSSYPITRVEDLLSQVSNIKFLEVKICPSTSVTDYKMVNNVLLWHFYTFGTQFDPIKSSTNDPYKCKSIKSSHWPEPSCPEPMTTLVAAAFAQLMQKVSNHGKPRRQTHISTPLRPTPAAGATLLLLIQRYIHHFLSKLFCVFSLYRVRWFSDLQFQNEAGGGLQEGEEEHK